MRYRAEIDGLRAIAVVPVVLFHAGFEQFRGGFVGVDIFFVISGYLITRVIVDELSQGRFSLMGFYERRARRILPALLFVVLVCAPIAWLWMLPDDMSRFALGLVAVATFWSNILFWLDSGYFAVANEVNPLLHTWSLAVEEQYYIVYPLLLMALWQVARRWTLAISSILFVLSLGLAQWAVHAHPVAAFYLLPTRAWELLAGVLTAFVFRSQTGEAAAGVIHQAFSLFGMCLVGLAVFGFDEQTPTPSIYTLIPVLGTCLIIQYAVKGTMVHSVLGNRMLVGLGLISYSAYLWHQPLFAFARYRSITAPSATAMTILCILTFLLAAFSWRFVEMPFRSKTQIGFGKSAMVIGMLLTATLTTGWLMLAGSITSLFEIEHPEYAAHYRDTASVGTACEGFQVIEGTAWCSIHGTGEELFVLWGDSHAEALGSLIPHEMLAERNIRVMVLTHAGCPPLMGVVRVDGIENAQNCSAFDTLSRYAAFVAGKGPSKVILAARWSAYVNGMHDLGVVQPKTHFLNTKSAVGNNTNASQRAFVQGLADTIGFLEDSDVVVVGQAPELQHLTYRARRLYHYIDRADVDRWHAAEARLIVKSLPEGHRHISLRDALCDKSRCLLHDDGRPLYRDNNHLHGWGLIMAWRYLFSEMASDTKGRADH